MATRANVRKDYLSFDNRMQEIQNLEELPEKNEDESKEQYHQRMRNMVQSKLDPNILPFLDELFVYQGLYQNSEYDSNEVGNLVDQYFRNVTKMYNSTSEKTEERQPEEKK